MGTKTPQDSTLTTRVELTLKISGKKTAIYIDKLSILIATIANFIIDYRCFG